MMKNILALSAALAVLTCSFADAAKVNIVDNGGDNYSLYLDGQGDVFDALGVEIIPDAGFELVNPDAGFNGFAPRLAGEDFSFPNVLLGAAVAQGGQGFSLLNQVSDSTKISYEGGPLGFNIDTTGHAEGLFLANVLLPASGKGSYNIKLVANGVDLSILSGPIPVPEPASLMLVGLGLVGFVARRRS